MLRTALEDIIFSTYLAIFTASRPFVEHVIVVITFFLFFAFSGLFATDL